MYLKIDKKFDHGTRVCSNADFSLFSIEQDGKIIYVPGTFFARMSERIQEGIDENPGPYKERILNTK